jgi:hypothetical protein
MVNFDADTVGIWINAFFALAAVSAVFAVTVLAIFIRRADTTRRPALELIPNVVPAHATASTHIREQARRAA